MVEDDGFEPRSTVSQAVSGEVVSLRLVDGLLRVHPQATPFGMPRRWRRPPAVRLSPGQWIRWQINYRFSYPTALGGGWTYRLDTLNVAHGQQVTADLFLREPTRWVKELARLR
jgi:hypothetical protein